jgi:hypothetical protein
VETHVCLPRYTPFVLAQNLYGTLFQYVVDPEREKNLAAFIAELERYVKSKRRTPFSVPRAQLDFLQEGLNELRLLNWLEMPVTVFTLETSGDVQAVCGHLEDLMECAYRPEGNLLYVYPRRAVF